MSLFRETTAQRETTTRGPMCPPATRSPPSRPLTRNELSVATPDPTETKKAKTHGATQRRWVGNDHLPDVRERTRACVRAEQQEATQIGRASCRERVYISV